jgi:hypothetical protein
MQHKPIEAFVPRAELTGRLQENPDLVNFRVMSDGLHYKVQHRVKRRFLWWKWDDWRDLGNFVFMNPPTWITYLYASFQEAKDKCDELIRQDNARHEWSISDGIGEQQIPLVANLKLEKLKVVHERGSGWRIYIDDVGGPSSVGDSLEECIYNFTKSVIEATEFGYFNVT